MATPSPSRRRRRSVRLAAAAALLAFATLVVVLALATAQSGWLSLASVVSLLCGIAASRVMHNELLQSRRAAAADRADQARAYEAVLAERAGEHLEFAMVMTDRLESRERSMGELDAMVLVAVRRAAEAESRVRLQSRRADEAMDLVADLQMALEIRHAEEADELASWESAGQPDGRASTVVDLLRWEDRAKATSPGAVATPDRKRA